MRFLIQASVIGALSSAMLAAVIAPGRADGWSYRHHYYPRHAHVAYVEYPPYTPVCRLGWWQSVRYGHVQPYWAEYCR